VLYEVAFTISNYADGKKAEHAVLKNILQCMRDADITTQGQVKIANRALDTFHLVQQARLFRGLPEELCKRIAGLLVERHIPEAELGTFSEVFIVGTAAEVTPVGEIGEFRFTPGNLSLSLMEDYASLVRRQPAMA
jgi:hypothetical protein